MLGLIKTVNYYMCFFWVIMVVFSMMFSDDSNLESAMVRASFSGVLYFLIKEEIDGRNS